MDVLESTWRLLVPPDNASRPQAGGVCGIIVPIISPVANATSPKTWLRNSRGTNLKGERVYTWNFEIEGSVCGKVRIDSLSYLCMITLASSSYIVNGNSLVGTDELDPFYTREFCKVIGSRVNNYDYPLWMGLSIAAGHRRFQGRDRRLKQLSEAYFARALPNPRGAFSDVVQGKVARTPEQIDTLLYTVIVICFRVLVTMQRTHG